MAGEATTPELFHSKDGIVWKNAILPENRDIDCCFEWLTDIYFNKDSIYLTFAGIDDENKKSWCSNVFTVAIANNPVWESVKDNKLPKKNECSGIQLTSENLKKTKSEKDFVFTAKNENSGIKIIIPACI